MRLKNIKLFLLIAFSAFNICRGYIGTLNFFDPLEVPYKFLEKSPFWLSEKEVSNSIICLIYYNDN